MAESEGGAQKRVDEALLDWRQGDCVIGKQHFLYRFHPNRPLSEAAVAAAAEEVDTAESRVFGFMVASQTCDLVRPCADRPYVEVCPLVEVGDTQLGQIRRAHRPQYAFIPGAAAQHLVADLDRVMTVEKPLLLEWVRVSGCETGSEVRTLAHALARKRQRFAFPDDFVALTEPLRQRLLRKHDKQSPEGRALRALREIRVRAAPSWTAGEVEIIFYLIQNDDESEVEGMPWREHLQSWLRLMTPGGRFSSVDGAVLSLDELSARDYVESDPLDLDHLSDSAD
ncbi:MAG: hypothetical protein V2A76_01435 [Planctomycetota bacterium]